jgi:hypothetical protein
MTTVGRVPYLISYSTHLQHIRNVMASRKSQTDPRNVARRAINELAALVGEDDDRIPLRIQQENEKWLKIRRSIEVAIQDMKDGKLEDVTERFSRITKLYGKVLHFLANEIYEVSLKALLPVQRAVDQEFAKGLYERLISGRFIQRTAASLIEAMEEAEQSLPALKTLVDSSKHKILSNPNAAVQTVSAVANASPNHSYLLSSDATLRPDLHEFYGLLNIQDQDIPNLCGAYYSIMKEWKEFRVYTNLATPIGPMEERVLDAIS